MAHTIQLTPLVIDTECYKNYWLIQCLDLATRTVTAFQSFDGHPLDVIGIRNLLTRHTLVTFNGIKYDMPIICYAMSGATNDQLKRASDDIIQNGLQYWQFYQAYGLSSPDSLDHIDMIEVAPGTGSLKAYAGKMHSRKLQDLPYSPDMLIDWPERVMLREYCAVDLDDTADLFNAFQTQLELREMIGEEHGIDVRSKSDAQIPEAVMKQILLPDKVYAPTIPAGTPFFYQPPEWLKFQTPQLQRVLAVTTGLPFVVNPSGGVSPHRDNHLVDWGDKQVRLDAHGKWVRTPKDWQHEIVTIGDTGYAMGTGGLHSTESRVVWRADGRRSLRMPDVAGYYPSLIVGLGIFPKQIGPIFIPTYRGWKHSRDGYKAAGEKKKSNTYKTFTNGTFGKLLSKYSIFYTPDGGINVTVTGQLALLMLIESLHLAGITVVSANTDGIVIHTERENDWLADSIIAWWESVTGFVMEITDAAMIAARDVNSYVMLLDDGDVKLKGAFAPPEPGPSGWPNPTGQVCVDAVVAYLRAGVPLERTIRACTDVRQFLYVRSVTGGGVYHPDGVLERATTLKAMRAACAEWGVLMPPVVTNDALRLIYAEAYEQHAATVASEYLGKVVRWYYGTGSEACMTYKTSGNRVPRTEGCRPLMTLPDSLPDDVDYPWYVAEAVSLLNDVGITVDTSVNSV
jgi:hypothetical protein